MSDALPIASPRNDSSCPAILDLGAVKYDCYLDAGHVDENGAPSVHKHLLPESQWHYSEPDEEGDEPKANKHVTWISAEDLEPVAVIDASAEPSDLEVQTCDRCGKQLPWDKLIEHRQAHATLDAS